MPFCNVYSCPNQSKSSNKDGKIRFFNIPDDADIAKKWIEFCGRDESKLKEIRLRGRARAAVVIAGSSPNTPVWQWTLSQFLQVLLTPATLCLPKSLTAFQLTPLLYLGGWHHNYSTTLAKTFPPDAKISTSDNTLKRDVALRHWPITFGRPECSLTLTKRGRIGINIKCGRETAEIIAREPGKSTTATLPALQPPPLPASNVLFRDEAVTLAGGSPTRQPITDADLISLSLLLRLYRG
ncbi:hypothetical protein QAD02_020740 [Eretmocerus hayati]|uniref:Uncharacterized protein n=1 Tax=Eretmocerus hayati TaxID=131215 RepID=A0ACC2PNI7_9HYME|nr:hypothetical protein QAD02_020740 [Eretmocerus hayati]